MEELTQLAARILDAVRMGQWQLVAALVLVLAVYAARTWGGAKWPWLKSDRGGVALAILGGLFGAVANSLAASKGIGLALLLDGLEVGVLAAGGWAVVKKALFPADAAPPALELPKT